MNDASNVPIAGVLDAQPEPDFILGSGSRLALYVAVGLAAGPPSSPCRSTSCAFFLVGSGRHWLVGGEPGDAGLRPRERGDDRRQGLVHAQLACGRDRFAALFGPLAVAANLYVQHLGFNAIFLVSDPAQKWKLLAIFLAELTPFLAGAFFLGCVFLRSNRIFGRVYFADLAGAGLAASCSCWRCTCLRPPI